MVSENKSMFKNKMKQNNNNNKKLNKQRQEDVRDTGVNSKNSQWLKVE